MAQGPAKQSNFARGMPFLFFSFFFDWWDAISTTFIVSLFCVHYSKLTQKKSVF